MEHRIKAANIVALAMLIFCSIFAIGILTMEDDYMLYSEKTIVLKKTIKILQISDTQIFDMQQGCRDINQSAWHCDARNTTLFVKRLVEQERPDLVIFAGDNVVGYNQSKAWLILQELFQPLQNVSFAVILGNHDLEGDNISAQVMYNDIASRYKEAVLGNGLLQVVDQTNRLLYQLFLFDYPYNGSKTASGYRRWTKQQIKWYANKRQSVASLIFAHLPLDVYKEIDPRTMVGDKFEPIYSASGETRLWNTMQDDRVIAYSCGHDHVNDFCGTVSGSETMLCYSGGAGYTTYGKTGWPRRARIFELNQTHVTTYKRLDDSAYTKKDIQYINV
jgi:predicted MPP superfamily phosphohydrolase